MKLMVISAHPDDETLGAGGTILKYKQLGHEVYWLNFTNIHEKYGFSKESAEARLDEIDAIKRFYDFNEFYNLELKPAGLDEYSINELTTKVAAVFGAVKPEMVIVNFKNDIHSDHRIVFEVTYSCTKVFRFPSIKKILMMEILSETDFASSDVGFVPNYFIDISNFIDQKVQAMQIYQSEIKNHPFPRSTENIRSLAISRGAAAGCMSAEGFILLKGIE